jgi:hypothetical protein
MSTAVLFSFQTFDALGASRHLWAIHGKGFWVHVVRHIGMGLDEDLVPALGYGRPTETRTVIGLDLQGRTAMRSPYATRELPAGTLIVLPGRGSYRGRIEPSEEPSFSMILEFASPAPKPELGTFRALARANDLALELCGAIGAAWEDERARPLAASTLARLLGFLRAEGIALPEVDLAWRPSAALASFSRTVDVALSQRDTRPMLVDLERIGACTARAAQRLMPAFCEAWGHAPESFRSHARRVMLGRACSLMTTRRATTEGVARRLGFANPQVFCRAMAAYGLPSPGAVRERFRALG